MKRRILLIFILLILCGCPKRVKECVNVNIINNRIYYDINEKVYVESIVIHEYEYNNLVREYVDGNPYDFNAIEEIVDNKLRYKDQVWDETHLPYKTGNIYHVLLECKNVRNFDRYYKIVDRNNPEALREIDLDKDSNLKIEYVKEPK